MDIFRKQKFEWSEWSEGVLFNANSAIFQLYHGEDKLPVLFNMVMMRSALY